MYDLRSVQFLLDEFLIERVLRLNLQDCRELMQTYPECLLVKDAVKLLEQTIADIESDAKAAKRRR